MNNKIWYPRKQALSQYLNNLDEIYFNEDNLSIWYGIKSNYSQTCIKRSPLGQRKSGLIRLVTS
jgi:hypothetical protein